VARMRKIVAAFDGSPQSQKALDWAIDLSLLVRAQVIVVKVTEMMDLSEMNDLYEAGATEALVKEIEELLEADRKLMQETIVAIGERRGVVLTTALLHGNVAAAIIDFAKENDIDFIVAGTKGHGVLEELLIGSVTRNLVSLSPIPVLVVKD